MEEIVPQHQRSWVARQEVGADQKRLGQPFRAWLHCVLDRHAPATAIAEQTLESFLVVRSGDDQHLTDPRQHQCAERVIDHWLVVNRQQLFADGLGDRMQPRATSASQDDSPSLGCGAHWLDQPREVGAITARDPLRSLPLIRL